MKLKIKLEKMEENKKIAYYYNNMNKDTLIVLESYLLDNYDAYTLDVRKSNINTDTGKKEEVYYGYIETEKEIDMEEVKKSALNIW